MSGCELDRRLLSSGRLEMRHRHGLRPFRETRQLPTAEVRRLSEKTIVGLWGLLNEVDGPEGAKQSRTFDVNGFSLSLVP